MSSFWSKTHTLYRGTGQLPELQTCYWIRGMAKIRQFFLKNLILLGDENQQTTSCTGDWGDEMENRCTGWFYCYQREQITSCCFVYSKIANFTPKIEFVLFCSNLKRQKIKLEKKNCDPAQYVFLWGPLYK